MRVYISADIEGVTGVVSWKQCGAPTSEHYDWSFARRMMTHDVNCAIRGARAAGVAEIVIKDSHNVGKNLLIDELEPGVQLISGTRAGADGMMQGISAGFDCCFLVGYHGMAGTTEGVMEHTISGRIHRCWVNDQPAGEMLLSALTAGHYGIPLVFTVSDDKGCAEIQEMIPGVSVSITKFGMGRHMARLLHPSQTGPEIESKAKFAVEQKSKVAAHKPEGEQTVRIEFNRSEECDEACMTPGYTRLDAYTVEASAPDWPQAHNLIRRAMGAAALANP